MNTTTTTNYNNNNNNVTCDQQRTKRYVCLCQMSPTKHEQMKISNSMYVHYCLRLPTPMSTKPTKYQTKTLSVERQCGQRWTRTRAQQRQRQCWPR